MKSSSEAVPEHPKAGPAHLEEMVERSDRAVHRPRETPAQRELAIRADLPKIRSDHRGVTEVEGRTAWPHGERSRLHAHQLAQSRHHAALGLQERAAERGRSGRRDVEAVGARAQQKQAIGEAEEGCGAGAGQRCSRSHVHQGGTAHRDRAPHSVEERAGQGQRSLLEARQGLRDHHAAVEADERARRAAGQRALHLEHVAPEAERCSWPGGDRRRGWSPRAERPDRDRPECRWSGRCRRRAAGERSGSPVPLGTVGVIGAWPASVEVGASRASADLSPPPVMMRARAAARVNSPEASAAMTVACWGKV